MRKYIILLILLIVCFSVYASAQEISIDPKTKKAGRFPPKIAVDNANENGPSGTQNMTPELLMSLERVSEIAVSPDGNWVMYKKGTPDVEKNKIFNDLYAVSIDGEQTIRLTKDDASEYNGIWSPDGKKIAYLSGKGGSPQIYVMDFPEGAPIVVSAMSEGVSNLAWSPDGKYFSFTSDVKIDKSVKDNYPAFTGANARIYTKLPVRHWDEWEDEKYSHLFIMPESGGTPKDLMPGEAFDTPLKPFDGGEDIAWSPDSKEIAYTCKKVKDFATSTNSDIYLVDIQTGITRNITIGMEGYDKAPLYSPDGKWIAFHSQERAGFESDRIRLMLYSREKGTIKYLSKDVDQWVGDIAWSPDCNFIYFSAEDGPIVKIYAMKLSNGTCGTITHDNWNYDAGLAVTPDGKTIVCGKRDMQHPTEIYKLEITTGYEKKLTHANDKAYTDLRLIKIESRTIKSVDGSKVQCWVLYPPGFSSTGKYPMITYCQGGPQATISQYFSFRWNLYLMASQGYVVIAPNRRGVPGFGQAWNDAISKDWGGKPMEDMLAATDAISKEPFIDTNRRAAVGASAGGYQVFWLEGNHEKRFSAFVAHSGVFNLESEYGSTEELFFPNWENGGPYWDPKVKDYYDKNSPHRFAQNWDTPILISAGEKDYRVPYTQALEAYTVAQSKGLPSELIIFPEENHWILNLQNSLIWQTEFFRFLDKYCKSKK